ncbi:hypothetical protein [uncultured Dubosiella sp.]|uniref:hypothetical protein n=1 Tax=uncultured Dubosiella sp. TaxID=1937011 RepID=UPI0025B0577B|nr:hypothetical protein [uncultured Dubosiella sp.]
MNKKIWIGLFATFLTLVFCAGGYYLYSNFKSKKIPLHKTDEKIQEVVKNTMSEPKNQLRREDGKFEMTFAVPNDMIKKITTFKGAKKEKTTKDLDTSTNLKKNENPSTEQKAQAPSNNSENKSPSNKKENPEQTEIVIVVEDPKNEEEVRAALMEELKTQLTIHAIMEVEFTPQEIHEYEKEN